jgi:poly-gamma-glutamate system protein
MSSRTPGAVSPQTRTRFLQAGVASVVAWIALGVVAPGGAVPWTPAMRNAAGAMEAALESVSRFCQERDIAVDPRLDPNQTCLVGPEYTELFTSLGQIEAKRTTLSPDVAGLITHLLSQAGVGEGDRVAIGASGSFPGLLVATLMAVEALGASPVTILSLGASSYGATRPDFHLVTLHRLLEREGLVSAPPVALSLGGSGDQGREFDPVFREGLVSELQGTGVAVLPATDLESNVAERMAIYGREDPTVFVNIGGAEANLGVSPLILEVPPGLLAHESGGSTGLYPVPSHLPPASERGVLFEMLSLGKPVIHLLHVRGLSLRYGLPWDPIPLPDAGSTHFADNHAGKGIWFWLITCLYFLSLSYIGFGRKTVR